MIIGRGSIMAKNEVRPYRNNVTNRYKKNSSNSKNKKKTTNNKKDNNDLSVTTRIRIDDTRLNDSDSLDTSFLEGRLGRKAKDNKKVKDKILKEKSINLSNCRSLIIILRISWEQFVHIWCVG